MNLKGNQMNKRVKGIENPAREDRTRVERAPNKTFRNYELLTKCSFVIGVCIRYHSSDSGHQGRPELLYLIQLPSFSHHTAKTENKKGDFFELYLYI